MSFRTRLLLVSMLLLWIPLLILGLVVRNEMSGRLAREYTRRVDSLARVIGEDLSAENRRIRARLSDLKAELAEDDRFRLLAVESLGGERGYVLDYAGRAMRLLGLSYLRIMDGDGVVVSSGHFRNEFDSRDPAVAGALARVGGGALIQARRPEARFLVLAAVDSLRLSGKRFYVLGGREIDAEFLKRLERDEEFSVTPFFPGSEANIPEDPGNRIARIVDLVYLAPPSWERGDAGLRINHSAEPLRGLLRGLDLWLAAIMLVAVAGSSLLAAWMADRISKPLVDLAEKTVAVDLDRPVHFATDRADEIGDLSRFLGKMVRRLGVSAQNLKTAERRATLGEVARQINHDLKNGLVPIRNVLRHLSQVAEEDPARAGTVYREREPVIQTSMSYLESLAANYARIAPERHPRDCDLNRVAGEAAAVHRIRPGIDLRLELDSGNPRVHADPLALRRILDNLVGNACQCLGETPGRVIIRTVTLEESVELEVADTGPGISASELEHIFDDFYTTRKEGSGLGLSIVRRLVADSGGQVRVESVIGEGTRFVVDFPIVRGGAPSAPGGASQ